MIESVAICCDDLRATRWSCTENVLFICKQNALVLRFNGIITLAFRHDSSADAHARQHKQHRQHHHHQQRSVANLFFRRTLDTVALERRHSLDRRFFVQTLHEEGAGVRMRAEQHDATRIVRLTWSRRQQTRRHTFVLHIIVNNKQI